MSKRLTQLQETGRCTTEGAHDLFFSERPDELAQAQRICGRCPVRVNCLELALEQRLEWGVWGGVIFWDGQPFHRRRGRGRPSEADRGLPVEAEVGELWDLVRSA